MESATTRHPSARRSRRGGIVVGGWVAGGAALGTAMLVVYVALTFELFCDGGVNDSYGAALALGLLLWLGFATVVVARPRRRGDALVVYAAAYGASLTMLAALAGVIWGPTDCGLGF